MSMEATEEMRGAYFAAWRDNRCSIKAGLEAVLAIVERDYVSRWGHITHRIPREFMATPSMEGFKKMIIERADYMGGEVVDIDNPEILPDEDYPAFFDYVVLRWKIRRRG